jgi:4-hydroxy-3-methylbut-2-en-1-yl diphosphate synthase IspG/GcpE
MRLFVPTFARIPARATDPAHERARSPAHHPPPLARRFSRRHPRSAGGAPIVVQSMTNTDTRDVDGDGRAGQGARRRGLGARAHRRQRPEAAAAVPRIRERLDALGCHVPLIGDFHFNGHKLLTNFPECAQALAKYRINPGNVGRGSRTIRSSR